MYNITGRDDLQKAIRFLEEDLDEQKTRLSEDMGEVVDSLRPSLIMKELLEEVMSSEDLRNNLINTTLGISAGYVTKKLFFGKNNGFFSSLSGFLLELGIVYLITHPPENLKDIISLLVNKIMNKDKKEEPVTA